LCGGGCPMALGDPSNLYQPVCGQTKSAIHDLLPQLYKAKTKE